ncbi:ABC transporter permease [Pseudomonas sp. GXZC]|uniref:ABC transporter permease n=1 Tax=Pseudomonas sp. GXZC TaxID=3003351 RepID=UPI003FA6ECC9
MPGWLLGLSGLAGLLLLWWLGVKVFGATDGLSARFSLAATFGSLWELLGRGELYLHIAVSLKRIFVGLFLALLVGVPLGLLVGRSRTLEAATTPAFQFLRMISPLSWMPIVVMLMGVGDPPIYFLLAFAAVWPIMLNTAAGVRQLDPRWLQLSSSLSATRWETLRRVIIPGVVGHVLTGVRLAIGILWIVLVPCEMLGVSAGLGYYILDTRDRLAYSELMAMVLLIGLLGFALDALARWLHQRWVHAG